MGVWFKFIGVIRNRQLIFGIVYIYIYIPTFPFLKSLVSQSFGGTVDKSEAVNFQASVSKESRTGKKIKLFKSQTQI